MQRVDQKAVAICKHKKSAKGFGGNVCGICLKEVPGVSTRRQSSRVGRYDVAPDDLYTTMCQHTFHIMCLHEWVNRPNGHTCPLCRQPIRPSKDEIFKLQKCILLLNALLTYKCDDQYRLCDGPMIHESSSFFTDCKWVESNHSVFVHGIEVMLLMSDTDMRLFYNDLVSIAPHEMVEIGHLGTFLVTSLNTYTRMQEVDKCLYWTDEGALLNESLV